MTSYASDDSTEEIKEAFSMFDTKGDGKIPCKLVGELLRALDQNPTEAQWITI